MSHQVQPDDRRPSPEYLRLVRLSNRRLERVLQHGEAPDPAALAGWEFLGTNTSAAASVLRIRKFIKGFFGEPQGGFFGYNIPVRQTGLDRTWVPRPSEESAKRYAFFAVRSVDASSRDNAYLYSLLLDYSRGGNGRGAPPNIIRDYLVRIDPGSDELFLGKAYAAIGGLRLPLGFFALQRSRRSAFTGRSTP